MPRLVFSAIFLLIFVAACSQKHSPSDLHLAKPAIYLYPEKETPITVKLVLDGSLIGTYPELDTTTGNWEIVGYPGGKLFNKPDGRNYSYLFWEGDSGAVPVDFSTGFVVKGDEIRPFLRKTLGAMGLSQAEINDYIIYWWPVMRTNAYNLIHFSGEEYRRAARLEITPKPDTELRVFMIFKGLDAPVTVPAQKIAPFTRKGFTVVEWGGAQIK